jgi:hypothetical protein
LLPDFYHLDLFLTHKRDSVAFHHLPKKDKVKLGAMVHDYNLKYSESKD